MIKPALRYCFLLLLPLLSASALAVSCANYITQTRGLYPKLIGSGSAFKWWEKAVLTGYATGATPHVGDVLVFKPWDKAGTNNDNPDGHVAIVSQVNVDNNPLRIRIDHANWGLDGAVNGGIVTGALVEAADANWSSVKMAWGDKNKLGSSYYETYGFVQPSTGIINNHWGFIAYKANGSGQHPKGQIVSIPEKSVTLTDLGSVVLVLARAKEGEAKLVPVSFEACGDKALAGQKGTNIEFVSGYIYNKEKTRKYHTAIGILKKDVSGPCQWTMTLKDGEVHTGTITINFQR